MTSDGSVCLSQSFGFREHQAPERAAQQKTDEKDEEEEHRWHQRRQHTDRYAGEVEGVEGHQRGWLPDGLRGHRAHRHVDIQPELAERQTRLKHADVGLRLLMN